LPAQFDHERHQTPSDHLLKYAEAARFLGFTKGTLQTITWRGTGPKPTYVGSRGVRFRMSDLEQWLDECAKARNARKAKVA